MKKSQIIVALMVVLLCGSVTALQAQRLEVRFNKEFSNDSLLNKTMGAGGSFIIDEWHPNLDFQINFDYAGHSGDVDNFGFSHKVTKFKAGVSALYSKQLGERFYVRVGGDVSYNNIRQTLTNHMDSISSSGHSTTSFQAHMLGIGAVAQVQAQLGRAFRLGVGVTPTYLIPLTSTVDRPDVESAYQKGIFVLQLQVGLEIRLNNSNNQ